MKLGNAEIVISREGDVSTSKLFNFLKEKVGLNLVPVRGQYDAYWLSGKDGYDMIDGNKYYKLILSGFGVGLSWASALVTTNNLICTDILEYE